MPYPNPIPNPNPWSIWDHLIPNTIPSPNLTLTLTLAIMAAMVDLGPPTARGIRRMQRASIREAEVAAGRTPLQWLQWGKEQRRHEVNPKKNLTLPLILNDQPYRNHYTYHVSLPLPLPWPST